MGTRTGVLNLRRATGHPPPVVAWFWAPPPQQMDADQKMKFPKNSSTSAMT
jgi:hypothetical protein